MNGVTLEMTLRRALAHHQAGELQQAESCYREALSLNPRHPQVLHLLGFLAFQVGQHNAAIELIERSLSVHPQNLIALRDLGNARQATGELDGAAAAYRRALDIQPDFVDALNNLGNVLLEKGDLAGAETLYRRVLEIDHGHFRAHNNLGNIHFANGRDREAEACFRASLAINPDYADAHNNLGNLYLGRKQPAEAETFFLAALRCDPDHLRAMNNLGLLRMGVGDLAGAIERFQQALQHQPENPETWNNLGLALADQGSDDKAIQCFQHALDLNSSLIEAGGNLCSALLRQARLDDAEALLGELLARAPEVAGLHVCRGYLETARGRQGTAIDCYRRALALEPDDAGVHSSLLATLQLSTSLTAEESYREHVAFAGRFETPLISSRRPHPRGRPDKGRLNIGWVSGDLHSHPVGHFLENVLTHLDRRRIAMTFYPTSPYADGLTQRLRAHGDRWVSLCGMSDDRAAEQIRSDGIDILIDLSGHTARNRLLVFARKPAPIQATWLGYFDTTGLRAMDYILCDRHVIPQAERDYYTERPWLLPDSYLCFTPPDEDIAVGDLPLLTTKTPTFGCFNRLTKVGERVVEVWSHILKAVPGACLRLLAVELNDSGERERLMERFGRYGVPADRLLLHGSAPRRDLLAAYREVDIALDPFPYPGGTTTVEALWMGVPVLTLKGDRFLSHVGESILNTVGLPDWVATSADDYVEKAVAMAAHPDELQLLRGALRPRLLASPLCDAPRFARHLEAAFDAMWNTYCKQQ